MAKLPDEITVTWPDGKPLGVMRVRYAPGVHVRIWLIRLLARAICWLGGADYEESPE